MKMAFNYDSTHNKDTGKQPGDPVGFNSKMGWGNVFERSFATPLDRTELFISYSDALAYATGGSDTRGLSGTSYPGQIVTVLANGAGTVYFIAPGHEYTQAEKDMDAEWYEDESENHSTFLTKYELESYTPTAPEGTEVGTELKNTRTLVRLGTKDEIDSATASAVINWLNADG
jgi:hypothetical protein